MCVAVVGGMDRLERHYAAEAKKLGIDLRVFSHAETHMRAKVKNADAVIIFTNKISHRAKKEVMKVAKSGGIPVLMCHSCGVCALRDCFNCVKTRKDREE